MITEAEYKHIRDFVEECSKLQATRLAPFGSTVASIGGLVAIGVIPEPERNQVITDVRFLMRTKAAC